MNTSTNQIQSSNANIGSCPVIMQSSNLSPTPKKYEGISDEDAYEIINSHKVCSPEEIREIYDKEIHLSFGTTK